MSLDSEIIIPLAFVLKGTVDLQDGMIFVKTVEPHLLYI
jgi:hypothetical protein